MEKLQCSQCSDRKVQAQRKFALGAYIPPSISTTPALPTERRVDTTNSSNANNTNNTFHNNMPVGNLLDLISFQKMHAHKVAVVLLKRLESKSVSAEPPVLRVSRQPRFMGLVSATSSKQATSGIIGSRQLKTPPEVSPGRFSMRLRAQGSPIRDSVLVQAKKVNKRAVKGDSLTKKRKIQPRAESFDVDDDKPLKYFARAVCRSENRQVITPTNGKKITLRARVVESAGGVVDSGRVQAGPSIPRAATRAATRAALRIGKPKKRPSTNLNKLKKHSPGTDTFKKPNPLRSSSVPAMVTKKWSSHKKEKCLHNKMQASASSDTKITYTVTNVDSTPCSSSTPLKRNEQQTANSVLTLKEDIEKTTNNNSNLICHCNSESLVKENHDRDCRVNSREPKNKQEKTIDSSTLPSSLMKLHICEDEIEERVPSTSNFSPHNSNPPVSSMSIHRPGEVAENSASSPSHFAPDNQTLPLIVTNQPPQDDKDWTISTREQDVSFDSIVKETPSDEGENWEASRNLITLDYAISSKSSPNEETENYTTSTSPFLPDISNSQIAPDDKSENSTFPINNFTHRAQNTSTSSTSLLELDTRNLDNPDVDWISSVGSLPPVVPEEEVVDSRYINNFSPRRHSSPIPIMSERPENTSSTLMPPPSPWKETRNTSHPSTTMNLDVSVTVKAIENEAEIRPLEQQECPNGPPDLLSPVEAITSEPILPVPIPAKPIPAVPIPAEPMPAVPIPAKTIPQRELFWQESAQQPMSKDQCPYVYIPIGPRHAKTCVMTYLTTVQEIVNAPESEMIWCEVGTCRYCNLINKVRRVRVLLEVYEFNIEQDGNEEIVPPFRSGQRCIRRTPPILPASAFADPNVPPTPRPFIPEPVYLNCLPPTSLHIVQLTEVNKMILRSRLVKKTDCNITNEFSLIKHESLLDQLLENEILIDAGQSRPGKRKAKYTILINDSSDDSDENESANAIRSLQSQLVANHRLKAARSASNPSTSHSAPPTIVTSANVNVSGAHVAPIAVGTSTAPPVTPAASTACAAYAIPAVVTSSAIPVAPSAFAAPVIPATPTVLADVAMSPAPVELAKPATTAAPIVSTGSIMRTASIEPSAPTAFAADTLPVTYAAPVASCEPLTTSTPVVSAEAAASTAPNTKRNKQGTKKATRACTSSTSREDTADTSLPNTIPRESESCKVVDAPVFYPTEAEFNDPVAYFEKIAPSAAKYGLCKVVPPGGFFPTCMFSEEIRFNVANQYISRVYSRWGPAAREMCAIKAYLASQSVMFARAPLFEGIEVNLPKLYHIVQRNGGLRKVIEKKRWGRVAEEMRFTRGPNPEKRVDQLYVKYLLPYDTLSNQERNEMMNAVERCWNKKNQKMLKRAVNPLHRQRRLLGESESSSEETEDETNITKALAEAEDCVVSGRSMNLASFKKVSSQAKNTLFPSNEQPSPTEVEKEYWRLVLVGTDHVCVNTASIATGDEGYGFTKNKSDPYGKHPWNLKMLSQNPGNVLRSLGPVLGVTVPTLHLGMVFSTSCWHRDPHGLPWVEYMHTGPGKIWYGIPDEQSNMFRKAVEVLCPTSCQNKSIWLPSDITMIPPSLLCDQNVFLSRVVQNPCEFILVFPKAYSSSICTGFTQSESVYFATNSWLKSVTQVFQEVRDSCEPTMFSLEQLLLAVAQDPRVELRVVADVLAGLAMVVGDELRHRRILTNPPHNVNIAAKPPKSMRHPKKRTRGAWNVRDQPECEICRTTLYLSMVTGLTGKRSAVCLPHARRLLSAAPTAPPNVSLVLFYKEQQLQDVLATAEARLNV